MSDLISRQAAINAIENTECELLSCEWDELTNAIMQVPSSEPEPCEEARHILDYLDNVLHPLVSPENWNVYSELHDMVATLTSAEPKKGRWIFARYFVWECSKCGKNPTKGMGYTQSRSELFRYCPNCGTEMEVTE